LGVWGQKVENFLEGENRFQAQGIVLALGVYLADMNLAEVACG
jgi:hypothetical protein